MGTRRVACALGIGVGFLLVVPSVWAADGESAEAASVATDHATREQILQTIEATRQTDPELAAEMERQLEHWEHAETDQGSGAERGEDDLPPEARQELEALFQQGTGDPNSETDRQLREKAHEILERYGIEPRELGAGHEGWERGEGFERMTSETPVREVESATRESEPPMHEYQHEGYPNP